MTDLVIEQRPDETREQYLERVREIAFQAGFQAQMQAQQPSMMFVLGLIAVVGIVTLLLWVL